MEKDVNESQLALSHAMAKPQISSAFQLHLNSVFILFILFVLLAFVKRYILLHIFTVLVDNGDSGKPVRFRTGLSESPLSEFAICWLCRAPVKL